MYRHPDQRARPMTDQLDSVILIGFQGGHEVFVGSFCGVESMNRRSEEDRLGYCEGTEWVQMGFWWSQERIRTRDPYIGGMWRLFCGRLMASERILG